MSIRYKRLDIYHGTLSNSLTKLLPTPPAVPFVISKAILSKGHICYETLYDVSLCL